MLSPNIFELAPLFNIFSKLNSMELFVLLGSLWFTGRILFYLLFRGFYHIGIEKIVTMWPTNDLIALTQKASRDVGAQPPLSKKQNVNI